MHRFLLFLISFLLFSQNSWSHPTSFKGSKGVMGSHSPNLMHMQINYSFEYWFAFGIHHLRRPDAGRFHASLASTNFLIKRWNGEAAQANLYGILGAGRSSLSGQSRGVGYGLLQFDIEDRKLYFLANTQALRSKDQLEYLEHKLRLGFAPYVADFKGIHSWLILEYADTKLLGRSHQDDLTPFLRIFHNNVLFEIGQSIRGMTRFNYIIHF